MSIKIWAAVCAASCTAAILVSPVTAHGQGTLSDTSSRNSPVAYVYVSGTPGGSSVNEIVAYAASKNGKLTPVSGSPFTADVTSMAVNGLYLFGTNRNGIDVDTYSIESNGSLQLVNETDAAKTTTNDCGASGSIFLDHSGQNLYDMTYRADCANNAYQAFQVIKKDGGLKYLGTAEYSRWLSQPAAIVGNDRYAYSASCIGDMYWAIYGLQRGSNGMLTPISNFSATLPAAKAGDFWCPSQVAADPTDHVAIALQPVNGLTFTPDGGAQIGSFTSASGGSLSTRNTRSTMPVATVGTVTEMRMSYAGSMLAVAGTKGIQIFHWNGPYAPTVETGLLTNETITHLYWDKWNHLYAISPTSGKLHVYTITPKGHKEAPGSPYKIASPQNLIVQPWPLPWAK